jgi:predicted component of type VI protein secretion system
MDTPHPDTAAALDKVDVSVVETLTGIRRDYDSIQQLLNKANERKENVAPPVYARVVKDYETRMSALEDRARPLREQARGQLAELMKLHAEIKADWEAAQLAQQEIEFRHEVGELSNEDFEPKRKTATAAVEERQRTFERADTLRQRFEGVLPPEMVAAPAPPPAPRLADAPTGPTPRPSQEPPAAARPTEVAAPAADPAASSGVPDRTESMMIPNLPPLPTKEPAAKPAEASAKAAPAPATGDIGGTVVVPPPSNANKPKLVEETAGGVVGRTYILGPSTTIGRTADNLIAADIRELSRHHARIDQRDGVFVLVDLNSGNGTFVNGKKITEHRLTAGDRVQFGTLKFVYQAG